MFLLMDVLSFHIIVHGDNIMDNYRHAPNYAPQHRVVSLTLKPSKDSQEKPMKVTAYHLLNPS